MTIDTADLKATADAVLAQTGPNVTGSAAWFRPRAVALASGCMALLADNEQLRKACATWQSIFTGFPHDAQQALREMRERLAAAEARNEKLRDENTELHSQLLDPNATCCADATRKTKELREAHAAELAAMTAARDEACRLALGGECFPESVVERVARLRKVGAK